MDYEDLEERVKKLESDMGWFWFVVKAGATILVIALIGAYFHVA